MKKFTMFEEIEAWQKARTLVKDIALVSKREAMFCDFYLKDQIRRSSGSMMDNIVEGFDRDNN